MPATNRKTVPSARTAFLLISRVSGKPYFLCVLWSASGRRFYIGISEKPPRRLQWFAPIPPR
jgi:hypothetical protein